MGNIAPDPGDPERAAGAGMTGPDPDTQAAWDELNADLCGTCGAPLNLDNLCPDCDPEDDLDGARFVTLSNVTPERVDWLWRGYLPLGKLVTGDGDPSLGKSTLMVDIAARVSTGSPMPDGQRLDVPADVIIMSAEDGIADTIRPRLDAAGGDPDRVHVFTEVAEVDDDGRRTVRPPSIPADIARLEKLISKFRVKLVVIDVLNAFLAANVDSYRDQDVRRVLHQLAIIAERTGAVIVVLRHLAKAGGRKAIYSGGGSIGIIGAARAGLLVGLDPDDESRRILAVAKSNLAAIPDALAYRLVNSEEHGCARVEWLGATNHTADSLVAPPGDREEAKKAEDALTRILANGPVWSKDAEKAMAAEGFTRDQARRARERIRATSEKVGKPGDTRQGWQWVARRTTTHGGSTPPEDGTGRPEGGEDGATLAHTHVPPSPSSVPPSPPSHHAEWSGSELEKLEFTDWTLDRLAGTVPEMSEGASGEPQEISVDYVADLFEADFEADFEVEPF